MVSPRLMVPCEVCGLYEVGEHPDQVGDWCDGSGAREPTVPLVVAWLREQGAIDYGAATNITRELTSHLPADFEGSYDATLWTLNIVDAALRVEGEEE